MITGEFYKLPAFLVILGVLCAWCLLYCVMTLIFSLMQFYRHLYEEDPAVSTFMHSSPPSSFENDLKASALWLEGIIFMIAIEPGESRRVKRGLH
jgi:hypothetical protein